MSSYGSLHVDYCLLSSHLGIMKASFPYALGLSSVRCFQFLFYPYFVHLHSKNFLL